MSHSTWYLSLWCQDFLTELKPYFSLNKWTLLLFRLSIQTLATSPNRYVAGIPGSAANSSYLVKGIRAALFFSQECGMAELLTKSDRLDIQSLCSRAMPPTSNATSTVWHRWLSELSLYVHTMTSSFHSSAAGTILRYSASVSTKQSKCESGSDVDRKGSNGTWRSNVNHALVGA